LSSYAAPGNHSALPDEEEVDALLDGEGLSKSDPFARFERSTPEAKYLAERGAALREGTEAIWKLKDANAGAFAKRIEKVGGLPESLGVDLKLTPLVHTQYIWGQLAGKLIRIGNATSQPDVAKTLTEVEKRWSPA